ncbi:MAG: hypothetical protein IPJ65_38275 [Archangiaceae bacterium]|nr:hypothetical protein [Archangiaceae bacterium]
MSDDSAIILDSAKGTESLSIAKARHLVRMYMLQNVLEALNAIGMNPEEKTADRNTALIFLAKFADGEGGDDKLVAKMTPKEAQLIARLGAQKNVNRREKAIVAGGSVLPNGEEGQRLRAPGVDDSKNGGEPEGSG